MKIGFIGIGNMGGAILKGYLESISYEQRKEVFVLDKDVEKVKQFVDTYGCNGVNSIVALMDNSDIVFLGVKPNHFEEILLKISQLNKEDKILVSMAAGISIKKINSFFQKKPKIIRIMPNTPAQVSQGMIAFTGSENVTEHEQDIVIRILSNLGIVEKIEESLIHTVIGASGSSPAYVYLFIQALVEAAVNNGMTEEKAKTFVAQSVKGAAEMVLKTGEKPVKLCENVCSPNGTTIEAVNYLNQSEFKKIVMEGFQRATDKSKKMEKN